MGGQQTAERLTFWDKGVLTAIALIVLLFGALVVWRSAFMRRHTDFQVYARAGWAVRTGHDLYQVTDDNGLHYCYPPTFAVLMTPFAEPPSLHERGQYVPFGVSIAVWYLLSVSFAFSASHILANAVSAELTRWSRSWWALRVWPVLFTLPALGNNLSHSQVNSLVLVLIAGFIAAIIHGRSIHAGAFLAGAAAIKVIPAFLVLAPLFRRDRRFVLAMAGGLIVCLFVVPATLLGPRGAWDANHSFVEAMIRPALGGADGADRAKEMFHVLRTDNQSIQAILHAWCWWGDPDAPAEPNGLLRAVHWTYGLILTVATFWSVRGKKLAGNDWLLFIGALIAVLLFISPMCHMHYYCWILPLVMGLLKSEPAGSSRRFWLIIHAIGLSIPQLFESIRNFGFAPLATIPLWCLAIHELRQRRTQEAVISTRAAA